ncbi:hypothetical protein C8R44DRAFT_884180 [Mycena epipterygia]|nr:hypothetical protein C8R44DRAFT_884180 [Mycena epipterygia]
MLMWLPLSLLSLLAVAVSAQSSSGGNAASSGGNAASSGGAASGGSAPNGAQITVITSLTTSVGFSGTGRVEVTATDTLLITSTITPTQAPASPSGNAGSSSAASSTTTANLPTGTVSLVTDQAPSPGATGGSYGPDDGFINAAHALKLSGLMLGLVTVVVGGLLAA